MTEVWGKRTALVQAYRAATTEPERRQAMDGLVAIHRAVIAAERSQVLG